MHTSRDLIGYGRTVPQADWPGGARIAVQIVLNYEEGGENCILHGDAASEAFLSEIVGAAPWPGMRHMNMESLYEYGARAGFWRLWRLFTGRGVPVTVFGVATALARNPEVVAAMREADWEIASHGLKWIDYRDMPRAEEAAQMDAAIRLHEQVTGERPLGWYTGRSSVNTLELGLERGFAYLADSYADDLPYWLYGRAGTGLVVPYTLDANDMRFATAQGFNTGEHFFTYLRDSFDALYAEGAVAPKMMSVGLHCRLVGRPGRIAALARFLDHVAAHDGVWLARRIDIARHWTARHPAEALRPSTMSAAQFLTRFGDIFEDTPEIALRAWQAGLTAREDSAEGLHAALVGALRGLPAEQQRALIRAHPELAGRLAQAGQLTQASTAEQGSAGLGALTAEELARFERLNAAYRARFDLPFIMAIKGSSREAILAAFEARLRNDPEQEFQEALRQIERIAWLRLKDRLPSES
ncbi:UNVERIFIED_ORG: OHCU decarboxylase [Methylobacterium sp. SuP10 SLI 274]|uniref:allantoinase PuuE n=1 Tax=Methylorubrum extorquens TaxID=408 RepID=UPI00209E59CB|nr:allantoinase PuuE [Methylorubrum extorquens]MCP1560607.1 OHCU decarboxylase [Methylorubrum extorquens]MDF9794279.1 OHCU decarboxylase [Methylorubrum extorquens]MDH6639532.1 OHCU decarboxylase [Methylobacterium sp. SuP10 SLI 274]MDH6668726.1 OHCU decarboxylase [Methylorubrum zatmanii]